eukprot:7733590-Ditylum_brightwellii.AAC.1
MYNTLLDIFQGLEHDEDTAVNATAVWRRLKFNHYTKYSAETFLAKMNSCLKKMEVDDGTGAVRERQGGLANYSGQLLEGSIENLTTNHDTSSKFRTANQRLEGRKMLTDKEKKIFKEAYEKGEGVHGSIWDKLNRKEKSELIKAKRENKAQNNGGLGSQYSANQQMTSLPSGTILVPTMPQSQATNTQSQVNNATVGSRTRNDDQTTITLNVSGQESNQ